MADVENIYGNVSRKVIFISHMVRNSRGVFILIKERLNFELKSCMHDNEGRFIILKADVQSNLLSSRKLKMSSRV